MIDTDRREPLSTFADALSAFEDPLNETDSDALLATMGRELAKLTGEAEENLPRHADKPQFVHPYASAPLLSDEERQFIEDVAYQGASFKDCLADDWLEELTFAAHASGLTLLRVLAPDRERVQHWVPSVTLSLSASFAAQEQAQIIPTYMALATSFVPDEKGLSGAALVLHLRDRMESIRKELEGCDEERQEGMRGAVEANACEACGAEMTADEAMLSIASDKRVLCEDCPPFIE